MDDEKSSRLAVDENDAVATDDRTEERFDESPTFENLTKRFMNRPRTLEQAAVVLGRDASAVRRRHRNREERSQRGCRENVAPRAGAPLR